MLKLMHDRKMTMMTVCFLLVGLFSPSFGTVFAKNSSDNNVADDSGTVNETRFLTGDNVRVVEAINGTAFIAARNVEINETIDGDLFIAAQQVTINGTIKGSIFTASQNMIIHSTVENNIYSAGATLHVNSQTNGTAFLAGESIYVEDDAIIEKDVFIGGANVYHDGIIHGDLSSTNELLSVNGKIGGDLNYRSINKAEFSSDSEIVGETYWRQTKPKPSKKVSSAIFSIGFLLNILASLVIWVIVKLISRTFWIDFADKVIRAPLKTLGFGALALITIPIIAGLLMITIIGIPFSLILLALYIISVYIAKIILSVYIALLFQDRFTLSNAQTFWVFLLGLIILSALLIVPFIGWIVRFIIVSFGLGSIVLSIKSITTSHE